ncbi:hypothetical protein NDU88_007885 [Pleurodeles waltl]|uniref:Uncharacterized protein n=1 Tax=Pleurodeles waltl TaxID=8319 RepID=A0AAV7PQB2_PLEWA|nr:hypothetical protein NDU88_007885 [Pleurodeles waltl]
MSNGRLFPNANTCMFVGRSAGRSCGRLLYTSMAIKFMDAPVSTKSCVGEPLTMMVHVAPGGAGHFPPSVGRVLGPLVTSSLIRASRCRCGPGAGALPVAAPRLFVVYFLGGRGGASRAAAAVALTQRVVMRASRTRAGSA